MDAIRLYTSRGRQFASHGGRLALRACYARRGLTSLGTLARSQGNLTPECGRVSRHPAPGWIQFDYTHSGPSNLSPGGISGGVRLALTITWAWAIASRPGAACHSRPRKLRLRPDPLKGHHHVEANPTSWLDTRQLGPD